MTFQYPAPSPFIHNTWKYTLDELSKNNYIKSNITSISLIRSPLKEKTFEDAVDIFDNFIKSPGSADLNIGYHGTSATFVDSIIDKGLLSPMDASYKLANGNAYGKGVYLSTDAPYSVSYARASSNKPGTFLVCAYIKGIYCNLSMFNGRKSTTNPSNLQLTNNKESTILYPIDNKNELVECNCVINSNIHVLQGSCQVLPIFSIKLKTMQGIPANTNVIDLKNMDINNIPVENYPKPEYVELATQLQLAYPLCDIGKIVHLVSRGHIAYIEQQDKTNPYAMVDNVPINIDWCSNYVIDQLDNFDW